MPAAIGIVAGIILNSWGLGIVALITGSSLFMALYAMKQHYVSFIALLVAIGALLSMTHHKHTLPESQYDVVTKYTAEITDSQELDNAILYSIELKSIDNQPCKRINCRLYVMSVSSPIAPGAEIQFNGRMSRLSDDIDLPYETNTDKYLIAQGVSGKCTLNSREEITIVSQPDRYHQLINDTRDRLYNAIVTSPIDGATSSFLVATILGEGHLLTADQYYQYRSLGIAHILAISGLHVGIIAALLSTVLFPLGMTRRGRIAKTLITILLIWIYAAITGLAASVVRAAVMLSVYLCALHIQRGYTAINSLFVSVIILLCIEPSWLTTPGFQLSVCAVLSILMIGSLLPHNLRRRPWLYYTINLTVIPVAAMIGTGIVSIYYFNQLPVMFMAGNVITGILLPWLLGSGVILMLLTASGIHFALLGWFVDLAYDILDKSVIWLASFGWSHAIWADISGWVIVPYILTIATLWGAIKYRKLYLCYLVMACVAVTLTVHTLSREKIPVVELYIPRSSVATRIIIHTDTTTWLITDAADRPKDCAACDQRYNKYLLSRHCGGFTLADSIAATSAAIITKDRINVVDKSIHIVADNSSLQYEASHTDYALLLKSYRGSIGEVTKALRPDTILICANMHPRVRSRLISECADTVPYRDLRLQGLKLKW